MIVEQLQQVHLVPAADTTISFDDVTFQVAIQDDEVRVALDGDNYALVRHRSQRTPAEASILVGEVLEEERRGKIDYERYFLVDWEDAMSLPLLTFQTPPKEVARHYAAGQSIELGLEDVEHYRVVYRDGVEADIERTGPDAYRFEFSSGFRGQFWKDPDGTYNLRFRGDCLEDTDEARRSQSKFIVSRCRYSGNVLLILQDEATVYLT
jgi:hypothetical protein